MKPLVAAVAATALALVLAPAALADSAGLVAAYGFEEASGTTAVDSSPAGSAGVFNGATRSAAGRFGAAASFDGVNDRIDIADSNALDLTVGMTLEAWIKPTTLGWRTAILKERPGGIAYALYGSTDTNRPSAEIQAETRAPSAIPTNVWTHLASTYDGATLRLYVNGSQVASRAVSGPITVSSSALRIGGNAVWGEYFNGLIDEVRIYNRALTAGEIQIDMNTAIVSPDTQAPTAPALTATRTDNDVHLTWSGATDNVGVTGYRVYRDGTLLTTLGAGATSYDDLDRPYGTYRYTVRAIDAAGNVGALSNEETVNYVDPDAGSPTAPTLTATMLVNDDVRLKWSGATDDLGVKEYRLYRDGTLLTTVAAPAAQFDDGDPPNGTYRYTVVAVDNAGHTSPASNEAVITVNVDREAPSAPEVTASVSGSDVHLTWTAATDNVGVTSYSVYRSIDHSEWLDDVSAASPRQFTDRGLPDGLVRYYVFAKDAAGNSTRSAIISAHVGPEDLEPPTAPVLSAVIEGGSYVLRWTPSTDDRGIAEYAVWRNGSLYQFLPGSSITELSAGVGTGTWKVRAKDTAGKFSEFSNEVTIPFADTTPPTVTFDHGCNGTKVHDYVDFRPLVSDDRGPVTAQVLLDGEPYPGAATLAAGRLRIDWDTRRYNVPNGTHVMTIVARDGAGNETSAPCEWNVQNPTVTVPFTSPADGATVSGTVNLAAEVLTDGQTPNWTGWLPAGNPVTGVAFEVVGATSQFDSAAPYAFAWDSTTVPNGTYTVRARVQWMDYSQARATNEIQITVDNPVPLPAPTGLAPSVTDDDVTLSWNAVAGATGYRIQRNGNEVGTSSGTSFTDANVPVGTHQYRVIAQDGTRTSVPSGAVSATIAPPPASGLVAAYGFEQTSGTSATDSSGKGSTGTVSGATWAAGGKFGRALQFDGINDLVTVPDSNLLDLAPGMTLEAWVKPATVSDWRTVLLKERPGQLAYALYATGDNGRPLAEVTAGTQRDARGTAALPVGVWTHLAATYDKSTLRLYVNGTQVSSTAVTGTLLNSTGALRIGGNTVWGEYFSGLIDEVRVYERALSAAEIAADKDRAV